jgi:hypothetical protein
MSKSKRKVKILPNVVQSSDGSRWPAVTQPPNDGSRWPAATQSPSDGSRWPAATQPPSDGSRWPAATQPPSDGSRWPAATQPPSDGGRWGSPIVEPSRVDPARVLTNIRKDVNPPFRQTTLPRQKNPQNQRPRSNDSPPIPSSVLTSVSGMSLEDKLLTAMKLAVDSGKLDRRFKESLQKFVNSDNAKALLVIAGLYIGAQVAGQPWISYADAVLVSLGAAGAAFIGFEASGALLKFFTTAQNATSYADLGRSADHFAEFVNVVGTNSLIYLVGAKAGDAIKGLTGVFSKVGNNLNRLAPQVREGLNVSSKLIESLTQQANNAGRQIKDEIRIGIEAIDNLLGKKRPRLATEGNRNIPSNQYGGSGGGVSSRTLQQEYEVLAKNISLTPNVAAQLLEKGIAAKTIKNLHDRGMSAKDLNEFLNGFLRSKNGIYKLGEMPKIADTMAVLTNKGVEVKIAESLLREAGKQKEVLDIVQRLMLGKGQLENPESLAELVVKAVGEFGNEESPGLRGILREMQIAAERVNQGHTIQLGAVKNDNGILIGGDIVDKTAREVIQLKTLTSRNSAGVWDNTKKAIQQLLGKHGETANAEFMKTAEIRIGSKNELFNLSGKKINDQILEEIRLGKIDPDKKFDGFIKIVKEDSKGNALETLRFKLYKGTSQFVPRSQPVKLRSSNVTDNGIMIASNTQQFGSLLLATEKTNVGLHKALARIELLNNQWGEYHQATIAMHSDPEFYKIQQLIANSSTSETKKPDQQSNQIPKQKSTQREMG